jgi:hypothetical protein
MVYSKFTGGVYEHGSHSVLCEITRLKQPKAKSINIYGIVRQRSPPCARYLSYTNYLCCSLAVWGLLLHDRIKNCARIDEHRGPCARSTQWYFCMLNGVFFAQEVSCDPCEAYSTLLGSSLGSSAEICDEHN